MRKCLKISALFFCALPVLFFTGCDGPSDSVNGDLIDIKFSSGTILRIPTGSCVDKTLALTSVDGTATSSLAAPSLQIPNVTVTWRSTDYYLSGYLMKVTVTSSAILNGKYEAQVAQSELEAMFGKKSATIDKATTAVVGGVTVVVPQVVYSADAAKVGYAPCGLGIGSIPLAHPETQTQFSAVVQIQFLGSAHTANYSDEKTVMKTFTTTATYY